MIKPKCISLALQAAAFAALALTTPYARATSFYRLESATTMKGAAPSWDYITLEPARSYLYIGRRANGVTVYDAKAGKVVGSIENSQGANSATLVPEFDRGYTTNDDGTTTVFQLSSLRTLDRLKFGDDADSAFYDPVTKQLAFMMGDSRQIVFMNAQTGAIAGRLKMESEKLDAAAPDGLGSLFIAQRDRNSVVRIDMKQQKVTAEWPTTGGEQPTGLAFDADSKRIFVGCRGKNPVLVVMDSESGRVVTTLEIGRGNDGVIFDTDTRKIYTSNGVDANLVIYNQVDSNTYKLSEVATTRPYARTMALDRKSKKVYMVTAEGTVDPSKKINRGPAPFYPNFYFADTFTLLTYSLAEQSPH